MRTISALLFIFVSFSVYALEVSPYRHAKITSGQWKQYHDLVVEELAASRRSYEQHHLEVFSDDETRASIAFTMPNHEAHPAWVTRHVVMDKKGISIQVIGYFAGDEKAFKVLFGQYQQMANQTQQRVNK